jgi:site-specific recombinase XerD
LVVTNRRTPSFQVDEDLVEAWEISLQAQRKSPQTVKTYTTGVRQYLEYCARVGVPAALDKGSVNGFVVALLDGGAEASTARSRQLGVRRFSAWLAEEGDIPSDPLLGLKAPKLDIKVVPVLTMPQIKAMLNACKGTELRERRDEAILRFMLETGARAGEVVALGVDDVDLAKKIAVVRRGKGGKGRHVPFGAQTADAISRYKRGPRKAHRLADSPNLWLGDRGKEFSYDALHKTLKMRADFAGVEDFHPHVLRHTAASRWLEAGGSEGGLMSVAGWSTRDMIDRYAASTASSRAVSEAGRLNLGDL